MERSRIALLALAAGCYSPRVPEGVPCESTRDCPSPQRCVIDHCSLHDAAVPDAAAPLDAAEIDAAIVDASRDAAVLVCATAGLACGGAATIFMCGGHCWVRCSSNATWPAASQACTGWLGALGQIESEEEQRCVERQVSTSTWIGLRQSDNATLPTLDWAWNTPATPIGYTHWQSDNPNDRDDRENRDEQCGKIQSDGTWDDVTCTAATPFLCERS